MNDVHQTLHALMLSNAGAGEALAALGTRIYRDRDDFAQGPRQGIAFPLAVLEVGGSVPREITRRSQGWQSYDGEIGIVIAQEVPAEATAEQWETAREAVESVGAGLEKLLDANRFKTSATNTTGCWHDLSFEEVESGVGQFDSYRCWLRRYPVKLSFRRWRA